VPDSDTELERRLAAVERALDADTDCDPSRVSTDADDLEPRLTELESRVDELDAAVQAVRGFLGGVSAVNESVERRADAAVAAVERMERRLDDDPLAGVDLSVDDGGDSPTHCDEDGSQPDGEPTGPEEEGTGLRERLRGLR
jgi:hypothetical protein